VVTARDSSMLRELAATAFHVAVILARCD